MPKFKKAEILAALDKTIAKEGEEFSHMAEKAPEKKGAYEAEYKKWAEVDIPKWRTEAVVRFKADVESASAEDIAKGGYNFNRFGNYCPPWGPTKPQELDANLAGKSAQCSQAERARVRITLILEDKNGGITLSDSDEIFYRVLIPCR